MNQRKRLIQETVQDLLAAYAPNPERFRANTKELQQGERREIVDDLKGLPLSVAMKLVRNLKKSGRLAESNDDPNIDRQVELGRISPAHGEMMRGKPNPTKRKPLTQEEKKQIAARRLQAIQAAQAAEDERNAIAAGFPSHAARMAHYANDPRMALFNRNKPQETNEETLHELYKFAGLYARATGNRRELSPEEQARGDNPFLTPEGETTYPTGPLAQILGANEYVQRGERSVKKMNQEFKGLKTSADNLYQSALSGKMVGASHPTDIQKLMEPRIDQMRRILNKVIARANRVTSVSAESVKKLRNLSGGLPKPQQEPPHYYG